MQQFHFLSIYQKKMKTLIIRKDICTFVCYNIIYSSQDVETICVHWWMNV